MSPIGYLNPFAYENLILAKRCDIPAVAIVQSSTAALGCPPEAGIPVVHVAEAETAWAQAHRLALELECLLLSCQDIAAVSKCWASANDALYQFRQVLAANDADCRSFGLGLSPGIVSCSASGD